MPSSDYSASSGTLKFKGAGVSKTKKKKRPKPAQPETSSLSAELEKDTESALQNQETGKGSEAEGAVDTVAGDSKTLQKRSKEENPPRHKTEAELRFEEKRRKRLEERLEREGVKTHKEKVEELNRYLSGLSEHHDMYVLLYGILRQSC
jgi:protein FAM32A